jgi:hypothetical protein
MPKVLDKLGQEITVGCYIVYGHQLGRSAMLKVGKVLAIRIVPKPEFGYDSGYRITVVGVEELPWEKVPKLGRKGTLQFPDRCIVIPEGIIPAKYLELLNLPA